MIKGGVSLVLVPLHGLGSDQVDKATVEELAGVTGERLLRLADLGLAMPIESEKEDLRSLCDVLRRARAVLVLEGMME